MVLEPSDELEDHRRLCNTEGCGWLVEHDQLRVPHDRLGDGNSLALAPGERGDGLPDRANRGHPQTCQGVRGCPLHAVLVEEHAADPLAPEKHVLNDVEVVGEGKILVDGLDTERGRVLRRPDMDLATLPEHLALV